MSNVPNTITELFKNRKYQKSNGEYKVLDDSISIEEAIAISNAMKSVQAKTTVETGVASGVSAVMICSTLKEINKPEQTIKHYGIDPNQTSFYGSAALLNLQKENVEDVFELLEGPSHLMLPKLLTNNVTVDFAFIDGWHTFDYTLVDFFLIDKIIKEGGIIAFHDCYSVAKQKVLRFIETHRDYEYADEFCVRGNESFYHTFKFFVARILKRPSTLFSKYNWRYQFRNSSGLVFIRKKKTFEPNFDFFKNF